MRLTAVKGDSQEIESGVHQAGTNLFASVEKNRELLQNSASLTLANGSSLTKSKVLVLL